MSKSNASVVSKWHARIDAQRRSGLSVAAYCRRERLDAWTFYRWRTRFGGERARERGKRGTRACAESPFVDLGAVLSGGSRREIKLELGEGIVLTVVRG